MSLCMLFLDPNDPRKVIVKKLALCVADRPDMELDLTGDLGQLKKQIFVIKEGVSYRIRIDFIVQREIVHGLKYIQKTYRLGVPGTFLLLIILYLTQHIDYFLCNYYKVDFLLMLFKCKLGVTGN